MLFEKGKVDLGAYKPFFQVRCIHSGKGLNYYSFLPLLFFSQEKMCIPFDPGTEQTGEYSERFDKARNRKNVLKMRVEIKHW